MGGWGEKGTEEQRKREKKSQDRGMREKSQKRKEEDKKRGGRWGYGVRVSTGGEEEYRGR